MLKTIDLGKVSYEYADKIQRQIVLKKKNGQEKKDFLLLGEFDPVIILGRQSKKEHILFPIEVLKQQNISVLEMDRGGDVTFHGPGQLVIYPLIDLKKSEDRDLHQYLRNLEQIIISFLKKFNLHGYQQKNFTGVWVNDKKIASIGIGCSSWITYHGIGLNISTDLSFFDKIVPCGIKDKKMTSLAELMGKKIEIKDIKNEVIRSFYEYFA